MDFSYSFIRELQATIILFAANGTLPLVVLKIPPKLTVHNQIKASSFWVDLTLTKPNCIFSVRLGWSLLKAFFFGWSDCSIDLYFQVAGSIYLD